VQEVGRVDNFDLNFIPPEPEVNKLCSCSPNVYQEHNDIEMMGSLCRLRRWTVAPYNKDFVAKCWRFKRRRHEENLFKKNNLGAVTFPPLLHLKLVQGQVEWVVLSELKMYF